MTLRALLLLGSCTTPLGSLPDDTATGREAEEILGRIEASAHRFRDVGDAWEGDLAWRRQGVRADRDGVRLRDDGGAWELRLALLDAGDSQPLAPADWAEGACSASVGLGLDGRCVPRLEADHGPVVAWYELAPDGLKQGFDVRTPQDEVVVHVGVEGAEVVGSGSHLLLLAGPEALAVDGLWAYDAAGRTLPASMRPAPGGYEVRVDARGAAFPVTIDPIVTGGELLQGMAPNADHGAAVAAAGDVNGDGYDDVIVGAPTYSASATDGGIAYVYFGTSRGVRGTSTWYYTGAASARLGTSVAGLGDVNGDGYDDVAVGAYGVSGSFSSEGAVYVFHGTASGLPSSPSATRYGGANNAGLGYAVAGAGDVNGDGYADLLVGAWTAASTAANEGSALLYLGSASGVGASPAWQVWGGQTSARLGSAVAGLGDVNGDGYDDLAAAAPLYDAGATDEGVVRVYLGSAAGPATTESAQLEADQAGASFGASVAAAGDLDSDGYDDVVVGASGWDGTLTDEGQAFVYPGGPSGLGAASWTWPGGQASAALGTAVSSAGDVDGDGYDDLLVGAPGADDGEAGEGASLVFLGSAAGLAAAPAWTRDSDVAGARLGAAVAPAGDVDGDGFDELIVGSPDLPRPYVSGSTTYTGYGGAWVSFGTAAGPQDGEPWAWETFGTTASGYYGTDVDAGDFDGDGWDDLAVIALGEDRVYVYAGSTDGFDETYTTRLSTGDGPQAIAAGDYNDDGYDDLAVGLPFDSSSCGAMRVLYGSASGLTTSGYTTSRPSCSSSLGYFGFALAAIGDVNCDGIEDLGVGGYLYTNGSSQEGQVWVYHGRSGSLSTTADWTADADQAYANFGYSLAGAGDVNGDGCDELVVGAPQYDAGQTDEGVAVLFYGSSSGLAAGWGWIAEGDQTSAELGESVLGVGDLDGDGFPEIAVGSPSLTRGTTSIGAVGVWRGGAAGPGSSAAGWSYAVEAQEVNYAMALAVGDFDGDDLADLAVGSPNDDGAGTWSGGVDLYVGTGEAFDVEATVSLEDGTWGSLWGDVLATVSMPDGADGLLVGAYRDSQQAAYGGRALLYQFGDGDSDGAVSWEDCDDDDATVSPGAAEACDGLDNDCDGLVDEETPAWSADADGDGYGDPATTTERCTAPDGYVADASDCDDASASVAPGLPEVCDGVDQDCDGEIDEEATGTRTWYLDVDGDGVGGLVTATACSAPAGYVAATGDCDDRDATRSPSAEERCNGEDDDCDGEIDTTSGAAPADAGTWHPDVDGDGYGDAAGALAACDAPPGYVADAADCDDTSADVSPGSVEACDGEDDDCDGAVDEGEATGAPAWHPDLDGDGWGDASTTVLACEAPADHVADASDCDDGAASVYPGAVERCDGVDEDCDGSVDEAGAEGESRWYADADADGFGTASVSTLACAQPAGHVADATDCDDGSASVYPGAAERCDGMDEDCDGSVDEGPPADAPTWYLDADSDGHGDASSTTRACTAPAGYAATGTDCDDSTSAVSPSATEVCNGADDTCEGLVDEGLPTSPWYEDADGDGYGADATETWLCAASGDLVEVGGDCNDGDASAYPGAAEHWYDGVDQACDGGSDYDADGDGQDAEDAGGGDCDDGNPATYTGAPDDPYDGRVTDCASPGDYDADRDGHRASAYGGDDCDDADAAISPSATEVWYDGVDQDCDGNDDDQDRDGVAHGEDCDDEDAKVGACETGDTGETGDSVPDEESGGEDTGDGKDGAKAGGCGCTSARPAAPALGLLAAIVLLRRVGRRERRPTRG